MNRNALVKFHNIFMLNIRLLATAKCNTRKIYIVIMLILILAKYDILVCQQQNFVPIKIFAGKVI